jgi:hypothetical protein
MSGVGVPPDQRFFTLADGRGIPAGNGEIKVLFKDSNLGNTVFAAYTLTLVLVCQIK